MAQSKTIVGPHLKVYANGKLLGTVTSTQWTIVSAHEPARGIDSNVVQEFMPTTYEVQGTIGIVRLHGDGGVEGSGLVPFADKMLMEKYLRLDFVDRVTDKCVFSTSDAVVDQQSWSAGTKGLVQGQFSFRCSTQSNEFPK